MKTDGKGSGEHRLHGISDIRPTPSKAPSVPPERPPICPMTTFVEPSKLIRAWEVMVEVQRDLIRVIEKNEEDNARTRRDNAHTRTWVLVAMVFATALMLAMSILTYAGMRESRRRSEVLEGQLGTLALNVESTLVAVQATATAVGATLEGDRDTARRAARDARSEAMQASARMSSDPIPDPEKEPSP